MKLKDMEMGDLLLEKENITNSLTELLQEMGGLRTRLFWVEFYIHCGIKELGNGLPGLETDEPR